MAKVKPEIIDLLSSDEETPPLVNSLLNIKTDVKARKTARKSTTTSMSQISITPIKPERSKTVPSQNSTFNIEKSKANTCQTKLNNPSKIQSTFSFTKPIPECNNIDTLNHNSSNINTLNHNSSATSSVSTLEKSTAKPSFNGIPPMEISKKMPHLTITPIPKPSDPPVVHNSRTARKSVNSSGRHSSPEVQITATTLNKSSTYQNSAKLSDRNQRARVSTSSIKTAVLSSDSNKVTGNSSSFSNSISNSCNASEKSLGRANDSLYVDCLKKKARKSFPSSNNQIPPALISTLSKSGVSISNIKNTNSVSSEQVGKKSEEEFDPKSLKTSPDLSITKVKSDSISITKSCNDKIEHSGRIQVSETSKAQNNSRQLITSSLSSNKTPAATIVKSKVNEVPVAKDFFNLKNSGTPLRKVFKDNTQPSSLNRNSHMINTIEPGTGKCIQNNYSSKNSSNLSKPQTRTLRSTNVSVKKPSVTGKFLADSESDIILLPDTKQTSSANQKPVIPVGKSQLKPALTRTNSFKNKQNVSLSDQSKKTQPVKRKNSTSVSSPKPSKRVSFEAPPNGASQSSVVLDKRIKALKESLKDLNNDLKQQEKTDRLLDNVVNAPGTKKDSAVPLSSAAKKKKDTIASQSVQEKKKDIVIPLTCSKKRKKHTIASPSVQEKKKDTVIPLPCSQKKKKDTINSLSCNQEKKKDTVIPLPFNQEKKKDSVIPLQFNQEKKKDTVIPLSDKQEKKNDTVIPLPYSNEKKKDTVIPLPYIGNKKNIAIIPLSDKQEKKKDTVIPLPYIERKKNDTIINIGKEKNIAIIPLSDKQEKKKDTVFPLPYFEGKKNDTINPLSDKQEKKKDTVIPLPYSNEKKKDAVISLSNVDEKNDTVIPLPNIEEKKIDTVIPLSYIEKKENLSGPSTHVEKGSDVPLPCVNESIEKGIKMGGKEHESFDEVQNLEGQSNEATNDEKCKENVLDVPPERPHKQVTSPKLSLKRKAAPDETHTNETPVKKQKASSNRVFEKICSPLQSQDKPTTASSSTVEIRDTNSFPWKDDDDISTKYKKFLHFCKPSMKSSPEEEKKIVKTFLKQFQKADAKFIESTNFIELLCQTVLKVKTNPGEIFVHLSAVSSKLREHKRQDFSSQSSSNERLKSSNPVKPILSDEPKVASHLSNNELKDSESASHFEQTASKDSGPVSNLSSDKSKATERANYLEQSANKDSEEASDSSSKESRVVDSAEGIEQNSFNDPERASHLSDDNSTAFNNTNHSKEISDNVPETTEHLTDFNKSKDFTLNNHIDQIVDDEPKITTDLSNLNDKSNIIESVTDTETVPINEPEISTNFDDAENDAHSPSLITSDPTESIIPDNSRSSPNVLIPTVVESSVISMNEFYNRPSTTKEADYVAMLLSSRIPGNTLEEIERESYNQASELDDLTKGSIESHQDYLISKKIANSIPDSELPIPTMYPEKSDSYLEKGNDSDSTASLPDKSRKSEPKKDTAPKHAETMEEKLERRIETLEKYLAKLDKKIKKLQSRELSLDDLDDDDSAYMREDKFVRKFNKTFALLCKLRKGSSRLGREIERRFTYEGSRYEPINKAIEKLINKRRASEKFPNYKETLEKVREVNESHQIGLTMRDEERVAEQIFRDVGKELQRRRILDEEQDLISYCPEDAELDYDPADHDESLKSKLINSAAEAEKKIDEIMQKYVEMQTEEEKVKDDVMEVEETSEDEREDSDIPETEPATPSTDERVDVDEFELEEEPYKDKEDEPLKDKEDELKDKADEPFNEKKNEPLKDKADEPVKDEDVPVPISYTDDPDIIDIGSSSDASTEPGASLSENRISEARPSLLTGGPPVFISDEIEVFEDSNLGCDSSPDLPSLKTLFP